MDAKVAVDLLRRSLHLKRVPRTGWLMRGLADAESVAEHSWGVALTVLVLAAGVETRFDLGKALQIALVHDLPESVMSDIPSPAMAYFPTGAKHTAEGAILAELLADLPGGQRLQEWWNEFEDGSSPEAQLVRDADRLEMLLQAYLYEESRGCRLDEFWRSQEHHEFFMPVSRAVYTELTYLRERESFRD